MRKSIRRRGILGCFGIVALLVSLTTNALAETVAAPSASATSSIATATPPTTPSAAPTMTTNATAIPSETQWTIPYAPGRGVYASEYGWLWVPNGATTTLVDDVPYVYLYTPAYGWTWYVSPWGVGPYHYGAWVLRPWRPFGWTTWVAGPHIAVRLGPAFGWGYGWRGRGRLR